MNNFLRFKLYKPQEYFSHELLFVLYFWGFVLLRPIFVTIPEYSTVILYIYTFVILSISLFKTIKSKIYIKPYLIIIIFILLFSIDIVFRINEFTFNYFYEFLIYGAIPIHLLSQISDPKRLLGIFAKTSVIIFTIFIFDPLNDYRYFENYLTYGFMLALPSYYGIYIGRKILGYKILLPFELLNLIWIIIFANRSALLSILVFLIVVHLFYLKGNIKRQLKIVFSLSFITIIFLNLKQILNEILLFLNRNNIDSYSILHIQSYLQKRDLELLFSGRLEIWKQAEELIAGNLLLGSGAGYFQSIYEYYSHNLYFDILIQYGLFGLLLFSILLFVALLKTFRAEEYTKILGILFLCLWFPKLFFSVYLFKDLAFWCFIVFGYITFRKNKNIYSRENI